MSQSLAKIYVHIIFSTKNRQPILSDNIQPELFAYLASIFKAYNSPPIQIGGVSDHVHCLALLSKNIAASKLLEEVKKRSSKWIKTKGISYAKFHWQAGYGIFSVSQSQIKTVQKYIIGQKDHHQKHSFKTELRLLLKKYQIEYDERYLWD